MSFFLDPLGWVCSADLENFDEESYTQHFFVPTHWLSANNVLIPNLIHQDDLSFVIRDEIAIVKRGFEYREPIPYNDALPPTRISTSSLSVVEAPTTELRRFRLTHDLGS